MARSDTLERNGTNSLSWVRSLDEMLLNDKSLFDTFAVWRLTDGLSTADEEWAGEGAAYVLYNHAAGERVIATFFAHKKGQHLSEWHNDGFSNLNDLILYTKIMGLPPISQEMRDEWKPFNLEDH